MHAFLCMGVYKCMQVSEEGRQRHLNLELRGSYELTNMDAGNQTQVV